MPECSLIIAFYNKIDYLKLVLAGLERQSVKDFEIVIADDGSRQDVVDEIQDIIKSSKIAIQHIWHEDNGWQKNKMLNKAVVAAKGKYLIFIDGDCIPHRHFVKEHLRYKEINVCLTGRRVNLSDKITQYLSIEKVRNGWLEKNYIKLVLNSFFRESNVEKGLYFRTHLIRKLLNKTQKGILGCNFSLYKENLLNINGFDERYTAPSIGEDSDIQYRLELLNYKMKPLNHIALQYHLYHKELSRPEQNLILFQKIKNERIAFTHYGIQKV